MTAPIRPPRTFGSLAAPDQDRVRANLAKMQAQHAPDDDVESYLRDVEHLDPVDQAPAAAAPATPMTHGSTAAGLFAAPLSVIPGATTATGVVQGMMDAGGNLVHGRPANLRASIRHGIEAQAEDQHAADEHAPYAAAGLRGAAMALTASPAALVRNAAPAAEAATNVAARAVQDAAPESARVLPTLAQRAQGAAVRTAQNATTGAGYAMTNRALAPTTESLHERLDAAPGAALGGAAAGVLLPAVTGAVAGRLAGRGAGRGAPADPPLSRGMRKTLTDVDRSGKSLDDVAASYRPGNVLADALGLPAQRRLDWAMSVPTDAEPGAATFLRGRQGDRGSRLQHGFEDALGTRRGDVAQQADALATATKTHADANYTAARAAPDVDDPAILQAIDADPVLRGARDDAARIHARATQTPVVPLSRTRATPILNASGAPAHPPVTEYVPQPIAVLDLMKRTINDQVGRQLDGTSTVGHYEAATSAGRLKDVLRGVDAQRAPYAQARSIFATDAGNEDALHAGTHDALRVMPEEIARDLPGAPPSEQALYRQGAARNVYGRVTGKDTRGDASLNFFERPLEQQRVAALAASPDHAAAFGAGVANERVMHGTEAEGLRNSKTARRLEMKQDSESDEATPTTVLSTVASAIRHPMRATAGLVQQLDQAYQVRRNQDMAREVVNRYLAGRRGPEEFQQALDAIRAARAQRVPATVLRRQPFDRTLARAAGVLSGAP